MYSSPKRVAERIHKELNIPVFLYEESATKPERRNLATIRKGQFEGMPEKLLQEEWAPDYGDRKIHPTAGVTAVGARMPLVAFNVNLNTNNLAIANQIAKAVRGSSGGYKYCKAIGVKLEDRDQVQVSMNIVVLFLKKRLYIVSLKHFRIRLEAERYGYKLSAVRLLV